MLTKLSFVFFDHHKYYLEHYPLMTVTLGIMGMWFYVTYFLGICKNSFDSLKLVCEAQHYVQSFLTWRGFFSPERQLFVWGQHFFFVFFFTAIKDNLIFVTHLNIYFGSFYSSVICQEQEITCTIIPQKWSHQRFRILLDWRQLHTKIL